MFSLPWRTRLSRNLHEAVLSGTSAIGAAALLHPRAMAWRSEGPNTRVRSLPLGLISRTQNAYEPIHRRRSLPPPRSIRTCRFAAPIVGSAWLSWIQDRPDVGISSSATTTRSPDLPMYSRPLSCSSTIHTSFRVFTRPWSGSSDRLNLAGIALAISWNSSGDKNLGFAAWNAVAERLVPKRREI